MDLTFRSMEDSGAKSYLNCTILPQEVSEKININTWLGERCCDILAKNMAVLCPCPKKNLPEVKLKSCGLT